ncbi:GNAT family N-acetyltransferase [Acidocella sp.]|uniref:GNAT family N-acetyltransferase n=1 Tax=Acidocella sp. TaxID=50710 RepID=UPI003D091338
MTAMTITAPEEASCSSGTDFSPTIFHEPWWLRLASGEAYSEVTVESGGRLAGRLPFISRRRFGLLKTIHMPSLTHYLGPALAPEYERPGAVKSFKSIEIHMQLLTQLPKAMHIWFRLHPAIATTLAFDRAGFSNLAQWTVEIPPAAPTELWKRMRDKTRNAIRRASEVMQAETLNDSAFFFDFYNDCLRDTGRQNSYDKECLKRLIPEALSRGRGRVLAAREADGTPQAAIFTVWDARREYYFMSARRPKAHFGAVSLLLWSALQEAAAQGRVFDMDGIHVVDGQCPNLLLLSGFGGNFSPRYCVSRTNAALSLLQTARHLVRR